MKRRRRLNIKHCIIFVCGCLAVLALLVISVKLVIGMFQNEEVNANVDVPVVSQAEKPTVVIDAGHGGYDNGAISYNGILEKDIDLSVAKKIKSALEYYGVNVIMTRSDDNVTWPEDNVADLRARSSIANASNASYFVSVHCNSTDLAGEVKGSEIYVYFDDEKAMALTEAINTELQKIEGLINREPKDASVNLLQLLVENKIPSIIVEMGFLTDDEEADFLMSDEGQNQLSMAIVRGILNVLGISME